MFNPTKVLVFTLSLNIFLLFYSLGKYPDFKHLSVLIESVFNSSKAVCVL